MNIFVLSEDPKICASYHCDKHVTKMVLEGIQVLSIAARLSSATDPLLYRISHANHPITKWAMESSGNYKWLCRLTRNLILEFELRYKNFGHKSKPVFEACLNSVDVIPCGAMTEHPLCMPEYCKTRSVVESYRNYYRHEKAHFATWRTRIPHWY